MSGFEEAAAQQSLERSLDALSFGLVENARASDPATAELASVDMCQVVQFNAIGKVGNDAIWVKRRVEFPNPILMRVGPSQYDGSTSSPGFSVGVEMQTDGHVLIFAQLREWLEDESQFITAADVNFCAWCPGAPKKVRFAALIHLTFMGFAAPVADEPEA